jgi:hypothetical protein
MIIQELDCVRKIGVHRMLILPDIWPAGDPANLKAGYPVQAGYWIPIWPDIRADFQLNIQLYSTRVPLK